MVTILSEPPVSHSAWRPILWEAQSDRYSSIVIAITSITNVGLARFNCTSPAVQVGDVIIGSGFSGAAVVYNTTMTVTAVSSTYFETSKIYVGTSSGSITRINNNFQMKCQTIVFPGPQKTLSSVTDVLGAAGMNYSTNHGLSVGDVIYTEGTADYDGPAIVVTVISPSEVAINKPYVSNEFGVSRFGTVAGTKRQNAIGTGTITFPFANQGHVQSYLYPELLDGTPATFPTNTQAVRLYCALFIEEFDDDQGLLQDHDYILSDIKYGNRISLLNNEPQNLDQFFIGSDKKRFLTNAPLVNSIRPGEEWQLAFISYPTQACEIAHQEYSTSGVATTLSYSSSFATVDNRSIYTFNPSLYSSAGKVEVWVVDASTHAQLTEKRTFIIDRVSYQRPKRFYFENYRGGFDAYTFTGDYSKSVTNTKTAYRKQLNTGFGTRDRGLTDLAGRYGEPQQIYSQFLTQAEGEWLKELIMSVNVFIKNAGDSNFTSVNIMTQTQVIDSTSDMTQFLIVYSESLDLIPLNN